jgi:hypothetical protein
LQLVVLQLQMLVVLVVNLFMEWLLQVAVLVEVVLALAHQVQPLVAQVAVQQQVVVVLEQFHTQEHLRERQETSAMEQVA